MTPVEEGHADSRQWAPSADEILRQIDAEWPLHFERRGSVHWHGTTTYTNEATGTIG